MLNILCFLTGPSQIISPPVDEFIVNGNISVFNCSAFLMHYVEWVFTNSDGESTVIISTNGNNSTKYGINRSVSSPSFGQLVIRDVVYSDRGQYMCRAINERGTDTATANLTVHGMCEYMTVYIHHRLLYFSLSSSLHRGYLTRNADKHQ